MELLGTSNERSNVGVRVVQQALVSSPKQCYKRAARSFTGHKLKSGKQPSMQPQLIVSIYFFATWTGKYSEDYEMSNLGKSFQKTYRAEEE